MALGTLSVVLSAKTSFVLSLMIVKAVHSSNDETDSKGGLKRRRGWGRVFHDSSYQRDGIDDVSIIMIMLNNKGACFLQQKDYWKAQKLFEEAFVLAEHDGSEKLETERALSLLNEDAEEPSNSSTLPRSHVPVGSNSFAFTKSSASIELPQVSWMWGSKKTCKPQTECKTPWKNRADYDEGMDFFNEPLYLGGDVENSRGILLFNLALLHHYQGNQSDALELYKKALRSLEANCDDRLSIAILFGIGQIQYIRGDHQDSFGTFSMSLALSRKSLGDQSIETAACLNCTGVLLHMMANGDSSAGLSDLEESLAIRRAVHGENHKDVGTVFNNIGRIYYQEGLYEKAIQAYRKALRIRRQVGASSIDTAATIFNLGQVYQQQGDNDRALRNFQEFLRLAKLHFGEYHRDICIVSTCIGQLLHKKKNYKRALSAYFHSLKVGRVVFGDFHSEIAITLNKLGSLYYELRSLDLALRAYYQGLQVELAVLEPGNPNVWVTYTNIAEIYKQQSKFDLAAESYLKVLSLQREHSADSLEIANTLSNIGHARHQKGDYMGALEVNQECLRLQREAKGDASEEVAATLTHIALVLLKMNMQRMALEVLTESYGIRQKLSKSATRDIAFTLYNIALIYHHQGSHDQALRFYLETARVEKKALGKAHRDLSITFYNIGQIYFQRGDVELAVQSFREALAIEREVFGPNHPTCARTLNEIGNIELQLGNLAGLMKCYAEALYIYQRAGMSEDHLVIYGRCLWRFELVQPPAAGSA